jgi:ribosomal protein L34E
MTYRCKDCEEVFLDYEAEFIPQGYDTYEIGDQRVNRAFGIDGCPYCLSTDLEDYVYPDEESEEDEES